MRAICFRLGSPRASDSAKCSACSALTLRRQGRLEWIHHRFQNRRAGRVQELLNGRPQFFGSSTLKPMPPQACANAAKSIGLQIHSILRIAQKDHLLPLDLSQRVVLDDDDLDRQLVLHRGRRSRPSTWRIRHRPQTRRTADRDRRVAPRCVYGKPGAMVARLPDRLCIWPRLTGISRAHQVAIVPLSQLTMASLRRRLPSSQATTCGFIGLSMRVARFSISFPPIFHSRLGRLEETAVVFLFQQRSQVLQHCVGCRPPVRLPPDNASPMRLGSRSICTPFA